MTTSDVWSTARPDARRSNDALATTTGAVPQRTQCGLFHLFEVSRKCASDDLLYQPGGTPQSLLQAHLAHARSDAIPRLCSLSLGLCCQGENGRDVCKTTAVFSGMENQVKRQIKINITNSPPAWGTPSRRGRTKENLTHFFGHYHRILDDVANDIIAEMEQNVTAPVKKGPFHV